MNDRTPTRRVFPQTYRAREVELAERVVKIEMPTWVTCPDRSAKPRVDRLVPDQPVRPRFF